MLTMTIGMLWVDASQRPFAIRLQEALNYYENKYGITPNHCYVHPETAPAGVVLDVRVRNTGTVPVNHFWLGVVEGNHEQQPIS